MKHLALLFAAALLAMPVLTAVAPAASSTKKKAKSTARKTATRRKAVPKPPPVSAEQKAEAAETVQSHMSEAMELGIQNAAAMVPFYELLFRQEQQSGGEPLRVLQFGDSHTASDDWAGELRARFQQKFGNGGPGFVQAGRPFAGFRRFDAKSTMSRNWKPEGLLAREGDGLYGIAGVSMATGYANETITLDAEGQTFEFFYLQQPGGGSFTLEDNDVVLDTVSTDGAVGPGFYRKELASGAHHLVLRTLNSAPVRVHGWVLEKRGGITWEQLGINGAQADLLLLWDQQTLRKEIERRNPALVVLAYGTNEARRPDWTAESYAASLKQVVQTIRAASPTTSILIIGAPDQAIYSRRRIVPYEAVDKILIAQREAALANGCAFWNLRAAMGGKGSMKQWVQAGLAQGDFVHFTSPGYRLVGDSLFELIMGQYGVFQTVRRQVLGANDNGPSIKTH
ncbi:GDSL-type esterase/lipase family protein [uncultured Paludibaculum sp.]|uniref:GDSL-type esterase/lipase family protein n=1 Tax=uncultured Paludibaculum sp. TaxID=1765020 RepID=UPI002AAC1F7F|nr:GDSL-type esterase/lipase family protein [uncultured Paludibaculum sp.]